MTKLRLAYVVVAFFGAALFHIYGSSNYVYAQVQDYALAARVDVDTKMLDQLEEKSSAIDKHLTATDTRINDVEKYNSERVRELSDRISTMQGLGIGISAALGGLQILGLLAAKKAG